MPEGVEDDLSAIRNARPLLRHGDDAERDEATLIKAQAQEALSHDMPACAVAVNRAVTATVARCISDGASERQAKAMGRALQLKARLVLHRARRA